MKKVAFVNLAVSVGRVPSWELFCTKNFTLPPCYGRFVKKKVANSPYTESFTFFELFLDNGVHTSEQSDVK